MSSFSTFIPIEAVAKDPKRNDSFDSAEWSEQNQSQKSIKEPSPQSVADHGRLTPTNQIVISSVFPRSASEALFDSSTKFRQLPCRTFISVGTCPYRERCVYLHDPRCICREAKTKTRRKNKEDIVVDALFWPVMPYSMVAVKLDGNRQPHVIQPYSVPIPQMDSYRSHDQAVYSMWMHFVDFCQANAESSSVKNADDAPCFKAPDTLYNAYTEKKRLAVFRFLSSGGLKMSSVNEGGFFYKINDTSSLDTSATDALWRNPMTHAANGTGGGSGGGGHSEPFTPIDIRNLHYPPVHMKKQPYVDASHHFQHPTGGSGVGGGCKTSAHHQTSVFQSHYEAVKYTAEVTIADASGNDGFATPIGAKHHHHQMTTKTTREQLIYSSISPSSVAGSHSPYFSGAANALPSQFGYSDCIPREPSFPQWPSDSITDAGCRRNNLASDESEEQQQLQEGQEWEDYASATRGCLRTAAERQGYPWQEAGHSGERVINNSISNSNLTSEQSSSHVQGGFNGQVTRAHAPAAGRGHMHTTGGKGGSEWMGRGVERGGRRTDYQHRQNAKLYRGNYPY